jgi:murein DD-endopeptidase
VNGPVVAVVQEPTPVLHAPLRGSGWVAFNALAVYDHRRAFNPLDGRIRIAERFAIDWMRLGPDGCLFHDDKKLNANFYSYGSEVLAWPTHGFPTLKTIFPITSALPSGRAVPLPWTISSVTM